MVRTTRKSGTPPGFRQTNKEQRRTGGGERREDVEERAPIEQQARQQWDEPARLMMRRHRGIKKLSAFPRDKVDEYDHEDDNGGWADEEEEEDDDDDGSG